MSSSLTITKEGKWIIATDNVTGIASQGVTVAEAIANLQEALELYSEDFSDNENKKRIADDFIKRVDPYSPPPKMPFTLKDYAKSYSKQYPFTPSSEECLNALDCVISRHFPSDVYHIGGYQEAALCIQPLGNDWIVYHGERGNMYDMIKCDNVLMACILFIHKITHDIILIKEMEDDFIRCVQTIAKE